MKQPKEVNQIEWAYFDTDGYLIFRSIGRTKHICRKRLADGEPPYNMPLPKKPGKQITYRDYEKMGYACKIVDVHIHPLHPSFKKSKAKPSTSYNNAFYEEIQKTFKQNNVAITVAIGTSVTGRCIVMRPKPLTDKQLVKILEDAKARIESKIQTTTE